MARQVSILLCTRNRAPDLRETLASLATVSVPNDVELEIIVVDNGSTDETSQVVLDAGYRCVVEPQPGVANARNRALASSRGELIVFVDDDIRFPVDWLANLLDPFDVEDVSAVAGCVRLAPHLQRAWMTPKHVTMYAGTQPAEAQGNVYLTGANMAFRRSVLDKVPGFDPRLGPGALGFSEESLFSDQLKEAGFKMVRCLDSVVEHHFRQDRLSRESLLKAGTAQGRSLAYIAYHWEHNEGALPSWWGRLRRQIGLIRRIGRIGPIQEGALPLEIDHATTLGYETQLVIEKQGPRRYAKRGLRPLDL